MVNHANLARRVARNPDQFLLVYGARASYQHPLTWQKAASTHAQSLRHGSQVVTEALRRHFRRCLRRAVRAIRQQDSVTALRVSSVVNVDQWQQDLNQAAIEPLGAVFAMGAISELRMAQLAMETKAVSQKQTTAEEIAERLDIELPEGFAFGEMPEWLLEAAREAAAETFAQDYWHRIPQTTVDDIQAVVDRGVTEGRSTRQVAQDIEGMLAPGGRAYDRKRATVVARTELGNMLNAGHVEGIRQLERETGLQTTKIWMSILGSTTRSTHAASDAQEVPVEAMFSVAGHRAPHPGHHSLPVGERANCQCTVLSGFVMENMEPDEDRETEATVTDESKVEDIIAQAPTLQEKHKFISELDDSTFIEFADQADEKRQALIALNRRIREETEQASLEQLQDLQALLKQLKKEYKQAQAAKERERKRLLRMVDRKLKVPSRMRGNWTTNKFRSRARRTAESNQSYTSLWQSKMTTAQKWIKERLNAKGVSDELTSVWVHQMNDDKRAFHRSARNADDETLRFKNRSKKSGVHTTQYDSTGTFVHELGHHVENVLPGARARAREFKAYRIRKSRTRDKFMSTEFPESNYEDWEIGNEDSFADAFGGNRQHALYAGKHYEVDTEIISMGLELMYNEPISFAKRDPEYFKFILGIMDGNIR